MKPSCSSSLKIHRRYQGREQEWNQFLKGCASANFYQRAEWLAINQEALGHDVFGLVAEDGSGIVGVFPLVRVRSWLFGDILSSMPFVNFGGPAASTPGVEARLVTAARELADELGTDYLEVRADRPMDDWPTSTHKVSMTVPLVEDPDELFESYSRKHRKNVRRSYKNDIRVESGGMEWLDTFFRLMEVGWRALGTPLYHRDYFEAVVRAFPEDVRIFVGFSGDTPIATAFNGGFRGTLEGMWAAFDPKALSLQPNYVLYWEMISWACRAGYREFHLGRSTADSGAQGFKAKWGAEPKQLYWSYHLKSGNGIPGLNPDNPRYRLAIRTWQKLPLPVLRVLGPRLARLIP